MADTNKIFQTRIQQKYDSYQNWKDNNPVLLKGEVAIVEVPAEAGAVVQEPALLIKVGDGTTPFNSLGFVSALAADIHDWAKADVKPSYTANEISGLADYISGKVQDTNTTYKMEQDANNAHILKFYSKTIGATDWTLDATITTADTVYDDTALVGRVAAIEADYLKAADKTALQGNIDGVAGRMTTAEGKITTLESKVKTLEENPYDDTEVRGLIKDNSDAIDVIEKDYLKAADKTELSNAIAGEKSRAEGIEGGLRTDVDAIKGDYLKAADKTALQDQIDDVNELIGDVADGKTVVEMIEDAQTAATYDDTQVKADIKKNADDIKAIADDYLKAEDKTALEGKITAEENRAKGIEADHEGRIAAVEADYLKNADKVALQGSIDAVAGRMTTAEGEIDALQEQILGLTGAMHFKGVVDAVPADGAEGYVSGDVVVVESTHKEYVYNGSKWFELGDEGSHITKTEVAATYETKEDASAKLTEAKEHANGLNTAMNARVEALEAIDHSHANHAELDKIVDGDVAKWNAAQANAEATAAAALKSAKEALEGQISGVDGKFANYSTTEQMNAAIKVETDRAVVEEGKLAGRIATLEAIDHEAYKAADEAVLAAAKEHAEGLVEGVDLTGIATNAANIKTLQDEMDAVEEDIAGLHAVANSGKIEDLTQGTGYVVFNCGSATVNV